MDFNNLIELVDVSKAGLSTTVLVGRTRIADVDRSVVMVAAR